MKKFLFLSGCLAVMLFSSCQKEDVVEMKDPTDPSNINVYYTKTYESVDDFFEFIGNSMTDYTQEFGGSSVNSVVGLSASSSFNKNRSAVDRQVAREKWTTELIARLLWKVKIINFTYWSTSYAGEPIQLSASICVPEVNDVKIAHMLSDMSLCAPPSNVSYDEETKRWCPTNSGCILMARVAMNHAVVVPDYEGRGLTSNRIDSDWLSYGHARQLVDAGLAALTILKDLGYKFDPDFGTYCIGISAGGSASYIAHKLIECDIAPQFRDKLNLKMSYSANGLAQHAAFFDMLMDGYRYEDEDENRMMMAEYVDYMSAVSSDLWNGYNPSDLYSHEIFNKYNEFDMKHPIVQTLRNALMTNDIRYNWNPQHKLVLDGSYDDLDILLTDHFEYSYNLLHYRTDGTENKNVSLQTFSLPISAGIQQVTDGIPIAHLVADLICFKNAIDNPDPSRK